MVERSVSEACEQKTARAITLPDKTKSYRNFTGCISNRDISTSRLRQKANGKSQMQVEKFSIWKVSRKKLSKTFLFDKTCLKLLKFV